jgi:hypothetical protein
VQWREMLVNDVHNMFTNVRQSVLMKAPDILDYA